MSLFLAPESQAPRGDWYGWSGPASPIAWSPNEVRWDERRRTFVRDGSAVVMIDGRSLHDPASGAPLRWPIRLFGPREGYTRVAIASRIASPELVLDLPVQLASRGVAYEAKRCDTAAPAGGNRLFELAWPGYQKAWAHHQWACGDGGCAAYVSISLIEPEAATLQAMPNTECGVSSAAASAAGPSLLFRDGAGELDESEQAGIFAALGLAVAPDGQGFLDTVCGQPAGTEVQIKDLNGDGASEVLIVYGNTCMSGHAGSSVALFVRGAAGYEMQLGFPGADAEPLETGNLGWPDLRIGGPGFCFPIWRWNGSAYAYDRDEPQEPGGCGG